MTADTSRRAHSRLARIARWIGAAMLSVTLALLTIGGIFAAGIVRSGLETAAAAVSESTPASVPSSHGLITVAVVLGQSGTDAADALAPYEVFARSTQFSVYTVAATSAPVPLNGGLHIRPTYTFAASSLGAGPTPDLIVVPAVNDPAGDAEAPLRQWITERVAEGAQLLGVCAGARVLAATGLLDGHRATSHWSRISQLEQTNPEVNWIVGERYVQDRGVTTTAGVTSGIPGALRLIQQLAGDAEAERIGRDMNYPGWSLDGPTGIPAQHFELTDLGVGMNLVLPWFRPTVGVALTDGVGEIDAVAPFEIANYSSATTVVPIGEHDTITTAHGIVIQTAPLPAAPTDLDRLLIPATVRGEASMQRWAVNHGITVLPLRTGDARGGFEAALSDLATHSGPSIANSTAKLIDYPARNARDADTGSEPRTATLLILTVCLAVVAAAAPTLVRRRHRPVVKGLPAIVESDR